MKRTITILLVFIIALALSSYYLYQTLHQHTHDSEVHVHSDFLIIINDTPISLTDEKYQSSTSQVLHDHIHLHDNEDNVVHRHAEGITFVDFLQSIGYTLTNECLTDDTATSYCVDPNNVLTLYVNEVPKTILTDYIPQEEDRILLYYGSPNNPKLRDYFDSITNESCIYSGTCPERGVAPAESCGLTCEL
jgi:hypothetical protein